MQNQFNFRRDPIKGKRINGTPESDIPEEVIEAKAAESAALNQQAQQRRAKFFCIAGSVLVWLPVLLSPAARSSPRPRPLRRQVLQSPLWCLLPSVNFSRLR
jgi:hypothetical protein